VDQDCVTFITRVSKVNELIQGKWTLQILCAMRYGPVRLSQLKRFIPSASKKALRANLRALESTHVVVRLDLSSTVLHVEYNFADGMREAVSSLLDRMADWSDVLKDEANVRRK